MLNAGELNSTGNAVGPSDVVQATSVARYDGVPSHLRAQHRWVTWRYWRRSRKMTKKPDQPIDRPGAWLSFSVAYERLRNVDAGGVGFVLGDGLVGIDLDECRSANGSLHEMALDALQLGSYAEWSPSGCGLHIFIRAAISRSRNIAATSAAPRREIYDGRLGSARYLTVTGNRIGEVTEIREGPDAQVALDAFVAKWFPDSPEPIIAQTPEIDEHKLDDEQVLQAMFGGGDGAEWRAIFDGEVSGYPSQSEADFALIRKLRFYTRADVGQMDRLFRRSGLMRPKWDEKRGEATYGQNTIKSVIALGGRRYSPCGGRYGVGTSGGRFGMVHGSVLPALANQGKTDILTYIALTMHADREDGRCHPSAARIAQLIGTTREHAQTSISALKTAGLVLVDSHQGSTSTFRLPAFGRVSRLGTGSGQSEKTMQMPAPTCATPPRVSKPDTSPVSKFDTQTDKEQSIDTGGEAGLNKNRKENHDAKVILFPTPGTRLSPSAKALRDDMLKGPIGDVLLNVPEIARKR